MGCAETLPGLMASLIARGYLSQGDIVTTGDGFFAARRSIASLLTQQGIFDFPGDDGRPLACDRFFDDWYLYAVPAAQTYVYSLFKLREQEYDAMEEIPADGDTPGVTVCFIEFSPGPLLDCLRLPTPENRRRLSVEINRVVAYPRQRHHRALKAYFTDPKAQGAYLIAGLYIRHLAGFVRDGRMAVPVKYLALAEQARTDNGSCRLPRFIDRLNRQAETPVCDHRFLYVRDPSHLTSQEAAALLATHTGDTSFYAFAAEVLYHARFLTSPARLRLPFTSHSVYASAIRADMTIDDTELEGPAPFHRPASGIVRQQMRCHRDRLRQAADAAVPMDDAWDQE